MATIDDIARLIEQYPDLCDYGKPASDALIEQAEGFLGLRFPDDYRDFLKRWGVLIIGSMEIYGICDADFVNSSVPDAIWYTNKKRQSISLPTNYVVFHSSDGDEYGCLDTACSPKSCVVIWITYEEELRPMPPMSFWDFILDRANGVIETLDDEDGEPQD